MNYSYNVAGAGAALIIYFIVMIALWVGVSWLMYWKVFEKAGKPGWAGMIPVYQYYGLIQIIGRPIWWFWVIVGCFVGMLIPILNFIAWIPVFVMILLISLDLAKSFGKDNAFGIGLWLLGIVFYPILGFGDARYVGPAAAGAGAAGGYGQPMRQPMGQPMTPPPGQYVPPTPGPAGQPITPPPPLEQPVQPRPLTPPPAEPAPPQSPTPPPPVS